MPPLGGGFPFHGITVFSLFCSGIFGIDKKIHGKTGSKGAVGTSILGQKLNNISVICSFSIGIQVLSQPSLSFFIRFNDFEQV